MSSVSLCVIEFQILMEYLKQCFFFGRGGGGFRDRSFFYNIFMRIFMSEKYEESYDVKRG